MASYINTVLGNNEQILYTAKVSLWSMFGLIFIGLITLPLFGLGLIFLITVYVKYTSTELAITNYRVIAKFGFISRRTVEINLNRIESIQVVQNIAGRICNYGSLIVSGGGSPQAPIPGISSPIDFRRAFMEAQSVKI